jgi:hypothetical protein
LRSPSRRLQECFLHRYLPESNPLVGSEGLHNEMVSCSRRRFGYPAFSGLPKDVLSDRRHFGVARKVDSYQGFFRVEDQGRAIY